MECRIVKSKEVKYGLDPVNVRMCTIEITGLAPEPVVITGVIGARMTKVGDKQAVAVQYLSDKGVSWTKLYPASVAGLCELFGEAQ